MGLDDLYREFEKRSLEYINDCSKEIGAMGKLKNTFRGASELQKTADYLISTNVYEMESLNAEIEGYRQVRKEFS
jgi:hypothetical protein